MARTALPNRQMRGKNRRNGQPRIYPLPAKSLSPHRSHPARSTTAYLVAEYMRIRSIDHDRLV